MISQLEIAKRRRRFAYDNSNSDFRSCQPPPRITIRDDGVLTFFPNVMSPTRAFSGSSWMDCCSEALMLSSSSSVLFDTCVQANGHVRYVCACTQTYDHGEYACVRMGVRSNSVKTARMDQVQQWSAEVWHTYARCRCQQRTGMPVHARWGP